MVWDWEMNVMICLSGQCSHACVWACFTACSLLILVKSSGKLNLIIPVVYFCEYVEFIFTPNALLHVQSVSDPLLCSKQLKNDHCRFTRMHCRQHYEVSNNDSVIKLYVWCSCVKLQGQQSKIGMYRH